MDDKRVIIYCRESRDDFGENYERIETQKNILVDYCKKNGLNNIINIVMDDNVSGTKFERLNEIKEKILANKVDVLVFKDASRLGRNLLESLKFIQLATDNNVEVLFESENYNEDFFPLMAWFNEQRAKDDSNKIRRVMQHKMETGELVVKPIYGYKKEDKKLVIDPITAPIVKRIFDMYIEGKGTRQIATILNYEGIPTPSQHHELQKASSIWIQQQVYRIINNAIYTGIMIYRKTQKKNFKSKLAIPTPQNKRIFYEDHHEPIISKEMFAQAQSMKINFKRKTTRNISLFSGLIECGKCGRPLIMRRRKSYDSFYECIKYHQEGVEKPDIKKGYGCVTHRLFEQDVIGAVMDYCKYILEKQENITEEIAAEFNAVGQKDYEQAINMYEKELKKADDTIEKIYDDRLAGIIDDKLYQKKFKEYNSKKENIQREMDEMINDNVGVINIEAIGKVKSLIEAENIDNLFLKRVLRKMIYFLPNEITDKHKAKYQISDQQFNHLRDNGGLILFSSN